MFDDIRNNNSAVEREFDVPVNPNVVKTAGKKKALKIVIGVVIAAVLVFALVLLAGNMSGDTNEPEETGTEQAALKWPAADELGADLPKPDGRPDEVYYIDGGFLLAVVENIGAADCKDYISKCESAGWTEDKFLTDDGTNYNYSANNSAGWTLSVYNIGERMAVQLYAPDYFDDLNGSYTDLGESGAKALDAFFKKYELHDILNAYCDVTDDYVKLLAGMDLGDNEAEAKSELQQMKEEIQKIDAELEKEDYDNLTTEKEWHYFTALLRIQKNM